MSGLAWWVLWPACHGLPWPALGDAVAYYGLSLGGAETFPWTLQTEVSDMS
jgi:hypothetical protein